jgi:two-component system, NarL family, sensor kinase
VNAVRHGKASRIRVETRTTPDSVILMVSDNGKGFVPEDASDGLGLWSIRSRAETLGGALRIESRPGGGTDLSVTVPADAGS